MTIHTLQPYFLLTVIVGAFLLAFFIFQPFLIPLVLAVIFAVVLKPINSYLLKRIHTFPGVAALGTLLIGIVCVFTPLAFLGVQVLSESQQLYASLTDGSGKTYFYTVLTYAEESLQHYVPSSAQFFADLSASIDEYTKMALSWVVTHLGTMFSSLSQILFSFLIFLIALYYFLRDGARFRTVLVQLSPLPDVDDDTVFDTLEIAVNSVIKGNLTVSLIQGTIAGVGFFLFGVPNPILWGVLTGICGLIPGIGTALVLVPAIAFLFITGENFSGVGLLLWGMLAVGLIDNFLGPKLVGQGMRLHPLVVLFSVLGGIAFFGPAGLFLGPLSVSLLFALLSIYSHSQAA